MGKNHLATGSGRVVPLSIRTNYTDLRKVGASAKEVFIKAASVRWQVDVSYLLCREWENYSSDQQTEHLPTVSWLQTHPSLNCQKNPNLRIQKILKFWVKWRSVRMFL